MKNNNFINQVMNMDCFDGMSQLETSSVDLIIIDPPYSTPTITAFGRELVKNVADLSIQEMYMKSLKVEFSRILKPGGSVFIFCDDKYYASIFRAFYDWKNTQMVVWDKKKIGMGKPFRKRHELIFFATQDSIDYNRTEGITHYPTVLSYDPVGKEKVHGAQKPVDLISDLIKGFSNDGDVVMDCFIGSGTTAVAAIENNRNFIGFELNETFAKIANERVENAQNNLIKV